jgi:N-acetylmuramoyl-L-alanine amidase
VLAGLPRCGRILALLLLAGCSAAPAPPQLQSSNPVEGVSATAVAEVQPTATPLAQPTATATPIGVVEPTSAVPTPTAAATSEASQAVAGTASPADDGTLPSGTPAAPDPACDGSVRPDPLPAPGSPRSQDFFRSFREPLAPAPLYDPPGPKRVGLQAGHWQTDQVPPELGRLQNGAVGGGKQEWEVNLDVARRVAALLEASGIQVDVLPATVPPRYRANAFIALHADGDPVGQARGFKVARPGFSSLPDVDDRLVQAINDTYGIETELPRDDEHISLRMRYYYAFNSRRYCHAVAPGVPQAIVEMGYLTSATDRQYLIGDPGRLATALADSLQSFLATLP